MRWLLRVIIFLLVAAILVLLIMLWLTWFEKSVNNA